MERLESLRRSRRREAEIALAAALGEAERRTRLRESLQRAAADAARAVAPRGDEDEDGRALRERAAYLEAVQQAAAKAARLEAEGLRSAERAQERYRQASREHRVLVRLRERSWRRWLKEASREEQKFLDEMHLLRQGRRPRSGRERDGVTVPAEDPSRPTSGSGDVTVPAGEPHRTTIPER
jgi:flagellar export protein FliJ